MLPRNLVANDDKVKGKGYEYKQDIIVKNTLTMAITLVTTTLMIITIIVTTSTYIHKEKGC